MGMTLTQDTKTTIGVTALCVTTFLGGALWIERSLAAVRADVTAGQAKTESRLDLIDYRLRQIEARESGAVTIPVFRAWASDLKERNPNLSVPLVQ